MKTQLVDQRNVLELMPQLLEKFSVENQLNGFDLETEDSRRHDGLNRLMKVNDEGHKGTTTKLMMDIERTTVTGFSLYADGDDVAYYFNLGHSDIDNRVDFATVAPILDQIKTSGYFVAHNAPFELAVMKKSLGYDLGKKVICTLQLAVTCFNADTYPMDEFLKPGFTDGFKRLLPRINALFQFYDGEDLTADQEELLGSFIAKESESEHSWNGYVNSIRYGYGLKRLSKRFLSYEQQTFAETLGGAAHMGEISGEQVAAYGADDAWTCLHLYHKLLEHFPSAAVPFFAQENPMIHHYAAVRAQGVVTNRAKVAQSQAFERGEVAQLLREMKATIRELLPFPAEPHEKLLKYDEKLWGKSWKRYRQEIITWANSKDSEDDYEQLMQCRTSISKEWAESKKQKESSGPSITYYQVVRTLLYDLCGCSFQLLDGKVQSDKEAQDRMRARWVKAHGEGPVTKLLDAYKSLAEKNQVIKLYINNYLLMIDPETSRVYPHLSSMLNSRRMALETPNLSQLAKYSNIAYVRGYFEADQLDHVLVSADWSGIELVRIGEESNDPEFKKVFGQLPHGDLHTATAADLLGITVEELKAKPDYKRIRTDVGKGANFNYYYSGALGTVARELNMPSEQMWTMVEAYRQRFSAAEAWRVGVIQSTKETGYQILADGNIRYRFESTPMWANYMRDKFAQFGPSVLKFGQLAIKKIQSRSGNQAVNSRIQGICAALAKRSILRMEEVIKTKGYKAVFKFPVHDELVYSVHKNDAVAFMADLHSTMCNHPDLFHHMVLDAALAVGKNYWGWDKDKNPLGQIELDEASKLPCLPEDRWGKKLTQVERQQVVDWLFT